MTNSDFPSIQAMSTSMQIQFEKISVSQIIPLSMMRLFVVINNVKLVYIGYFCCYLPQASYEASEWNRNRKRIRITYQVEAIGVNDEVCYR